MSLTYRIAIIACVIVILLASIIPIANGRKSGSCVAFVDGACVDKSAYVDVLNGIKSRYDLGDISQGDLYIAKMHSLRRVIEDATLDNFMRGMRISNRFSVDNILAYNNVEEGYVGSTLKNEINKDFHYNALSVRKDYADTQVLSVSHEEMKSFYNDHKEYFVQSTRKKIEYTIIIFSDLLQSQDISSDEMMKGIDSNFNDQERRSMSCVNITKEEFDIGKSNSLECSDREARDVEYFEKDDLPSEFANIFNVHLGESIIVDGEFGYQSCMLDGIYNSKEDYVLNVGNERKNYLRKVKSQKALHDMGIIMNSDDKDALDQIVDKYKFLKKNISDYIDENGITHSGDNGISVDKSVNNKVLEMLFNENADHGIVCNDLGDYCVAFNIMDALESRLKDIAEVAQEVREGVAKQKKLKEFQSSLLRMKGCVIDDEKKECIENNVVSNEVKYDEMPEFLHNFLGVSDKDYLHSILRDITFINVKDVTEIYENDKYLFFIQFNGAEKRESGNEREISAMRDLYNKRNEDLYEQFIGNLMRKAKITINEKLL